jgi:hypothetical protein
LKYLLTAFVAQASFFQAGSPPADDPFAFFRPSVTITADERARLDSGYPISRVLPARGMEVGVLAAAPVSVDGDRLVAWHRQIEDLKKGQYVLAIRRFSNPPRIEDLAGLELDSADVNAIRSCRPQSCEIKLSTPEMKRLQEAEAKAKGDQTAAVQQAFRQMVLDRVKEYLANGHIPPDNDHRQEVQPSSRFALLLDHTPFLEERLPELAKDLKDYPSNEDPGVESFLYWSKEHLARKAVISVTHLNIVRSRAPGLPDALVVGRDVFSTHYVDASLSVMALMRGATKGTNYLVYVNRTEVDVLHGMLAGMIRHEIQSHLKNAANVLMDVRQKLQSGDPPHGEAQ